MRSKLVLCGVLAAASAAYAKDPKPYQTGKLVEMDSVQCGTTEREHKTFADKMLGTDSSDEKTQEPVCQEYVLQTAKVTYHIRPRDEKQAELLPVGDLAQFRMQKDKMLLRMEDPDTGSLDKKERQYVVVSMTPRTDGTAADATPSRLNHLQ
jgi:hypothetical protein